MPRVPPRAGLSLALAAALAAASSPPPWPSAARAQSPPPACPIPPEFTTAEDLLTHVAEALRAGGPVPILAVGSGTMLGPDTGTPEAAFPYRMAAALRAERPGADIRLTVLGGRGMTAADMLPLIREALATTPYALVVWQTGTVETVRKLPPADFARTLREGAALVTGRGADLVLVDAQYSRFLAANADVAPYEAAIRDAAALPQVALLRRYDLMRLWAESGAVDLERTPKASRQQAAERLHACLGAALAALVLDGVRAADH